MARYIEADKLIRYVDEQTHISKGKLQNYIRENRTADVEEVKHGKWLKKRNMYECSICSNTIFAANGISGFNYCHGCGAKMDCHYR